MNTGQTPIDADFLARQACGDAALQRELLSLFVQQAKALADIIRDGTAGTEGLTVGLHRLKGSAQALGAGAVAAAAEALERRIALAGGSAPTSAQSERESLLAAIAEARCFAASLQARV